MFVFDNSVPRKEKVAKIDAEGAVRLVAPTRRTSTCVFGELRECSGSKGTCLENP